ncbi:hypothetical protein IU431_06655 [Nocardia otitidiscaviarum]|uniref:hypothetical protein n=1 Tax=Nocardia otitidiscaviarum TaxID=1823 RepID=UPI0004A7269E|nr:hypothetical protein [Nocardia otitidiscaviarum]MBF6483837.1 hypothetical protein [Nocardia otitidiscaviarum]
MNSPGWLQHADGSWWALGEDGFPVPAEEFGGQLLESASPPLLEGYRVVDVEPLEVRDYELPD